MKTITTVKTITKHYIDGAFVESHGREVMDIINPTRGEAIAQVFKHSGIGREFGTYGIEAFLEPRAILE